MAQEKLTAMARFWKNVDRGNDVDACWHWRGGKAGDYGKMYINGGTRVAHAVAYEWFVGPIPPGHEIDHLCRTRNCVNPRHLEAVTRSVNVKRALHANGKLVEHIPLKPSIGRTRIVDSEATCPAYCGNGHALTEENVVLHRTGTNAGAVLRWRCKACAREWTRAYRERRNEIPRTLPECPDFCVHGHAMVGENAIAGKEGWVCRTCQNKASRESMTRKRFNPRPLGPKPEQCVNGHPMKADNVVISSVGQWQCRTCRRAAGLRAYYKRKAAAAD